MGRDMHLKDKLESMPYLYEEFDLPIAMKNRIKIHVDKVIFMTLENRLNLITDGLVSKRPSFFCIWESR